MTTMTISGQTYNLDPRQVEQAVSGELPEPIVEHFVVIDGRRWPPKQALALVTGLDRADFTTHQARRALTRLGFPAGRATRPGRHGRRDSLRVTLQSAEASEAAPSRTLAEALRPFIGQWVAVRGDEVLVAAHSPAEVVSWLARYQQKAQSVFRLPKSEETIIGAAPQ